MYNVMEEAKALNDLTFLLMHYDDFFAEQPKKIASILTEFRLSQKDLSKKFSFPNNALTLMARFFYQQEGQNFDKARAKLLEWVTNVGDSVMEITSAKQNGKNTILSKNYITPPYDKLIAIDHAMSDAVSAAALPEYGAESYPNVTRNENGFVTSVEYAKAEESCSDETQTFWKVQLYRLCQIEAESWNAQHPKEPAKKAGAMMNAARVEATLMIMLWYAQQMSEIESDKSGITMLPVTRAFMQKAISKNLSSDDTFTKWIIDYKDVVKLLPSPEGDSSYLLGICFADPEIVKKQEQSDPVKIKQYKELDDYKLPDLRYFDYGIRAHEDKDNNFFGITLSILSEALKGMKDYTFSFSFSKVQFRGKSKKKPDGTERTALIEDIRTTVERLDHQEPPILSEEQKSTLETYCKFISVFTDDGNWQELPHKIFSPYYEPLVLITPYMKHYRFVDSKNAYWSINKTIDTKELKKQIKQAIQRNTAELKKEKPEIAYAFACQLIMAGACENEVFISPIRMQCFGSKGSYEQYRTDIEEYKKKEISELEK